MKIGRFCEKFNVTQATVRFYIRVGLLAPNKKNSQYNFTSSDVAEMEVICRLKELSFSLEEIKQYLQVLRMYDIQDDCIREHLIPLYEKKKIFLEKDIVSIRESIHTLQYEIDKLNAEKEALPTVSGIPLEFSPYLACPRCNEIFELSELKVKGNRIYSGKLECQCGYSALIDDGVLLTVPESDYYRSKEFQVLHYRKVQEEEEDFVFFQYMHDISSEATSMLYKSYLWIDSMLAPYSFRNKVIFVPDLSSHFLYKHIKKPYFKDAFIIVSGFSKDTIMSIKSHIDLIAPEARIIYIANTIYDLPIQKGLIDLWVDTISSYNFSFFHKESLYEKINPYIKEGAKVAGLTKYYERGSKSLLNIARRYPKAMGEISLLATFKRIVEELGWIFRKESLIGEVFEPGSYYEYHVPGDKHCYYSFFAEKLQ